MLSENRIIEFSVPKKLIEDLVTNYYNSLSGVVRKDEEIICTVSDDVSVTAKLTKEPPEGTIRIRHGQGL